MQVLNRWNYKRRLSKCIYQKCDLIVRSLTRWPSSITPLRFLLDAIAGEKLRRKQISQRSQRSSISVAKSNSADVAIETTEKEDVKPTIQADDNNAKQSETQQVDDELDELMQEDTTESSSKPSGRKSGIRQSRISTAAAPAAPNAESASASGSVKRRRASFSDTDDELLESAGLTSTKRARNDWMLVCDLSVLLISKLMYYYLVRSSDPQNMYQYITLEP